MRFQILPLCSLLLLSFGCGASDTISGPVQVDLTGAVLPNADIVIYVDGVKGNAAPISKALREQDTSGASDLAVMIPGLEPLLTSSGLTSDSLQYLTGSVSGLGSAISQQSPETIRFAVAARLDKPLQRQEVFAALTEMSQQPDVDLVVTEENHAAGTVIVMKAKTEQVLPELLLLIENDDSGSTLRLASRDELTLLTRRGVALPAAFQAASSAIPAESYFWMAMLLPEEARAKMREQPANPMMGGADLAMQNLQSLIFSGAASDSLRMRLGGTFKTAEEAALVRGFLQGAVMPMAMMMFSQSPDGPPPALSTLSFTAEGPDLGISVTFSESDLRKLGGSTNGF